MFLASLYVIFFVIFLKNYPSAFYAVIMAFALGVMTSPVFVGINSLIHRESDKKLLGRIFSGLEFISHLGFLITMFVFSFLADIFTPFTIIVSVGIIGTFVSLMFIFSDDSRKRAQRPPT